MLSDRPVAWLHVSDAVASSHRTRHKSPASEHKVNLVETAIICFIFSDVLQAACAWCAVSRAGRRQKLDYSQAA